MFVGTVNQVTKLVTDYIRLSTLRSRPVVEGSLDKIADLRAECGKSFTVTVELRFRNYDFDGDPSNKNRKSDRENLLSGFS